MKKIKSTNFIEELNVNEMMFIKGGFSEKAESGEITIVYIGGKPYIVVNGELRPLS